MLMAFLSLFRSFSSYIFLSCCTLESSSKVLICLINLIWYVFPFLQFHTGALTDSSNRLTQLKQLNYYHESIANENRCDEKSAKVCKQCVSFFPSSSALFADATVCLTTTVWTATQQCVERQQCDLQQTDVTRSHGRRPPAKPSLFALPCNTYRYATPTVPPLRTRNTHRYESLIRWRSSKQLPAYFVR